MRLLHSLGKRYRRDPVHQFSMDHVSSHHGQNAIDARDDEMSKTEKHIYNK